MRLPVKHLVVPALLALGCGDGGLADGDDGTGGAQDALLAASAGGTVNGKGKPGTADAGPADAGAEAPDAGVVAGDAGAGDEGTRLSAQVDGAPACDAQGGASVRLAGSVHTTGSVDSVELWARVDGGAEARVGAVAPQDFVHDGREKRAEFAVAVAVPAAGRSEVELCLVQSGAQGREEKRTCAEPLEVQAACVRDVTPPVTSLLAAPAPNAAGWNRDDVTLQLTALDAPGGSGVAALHLAWSGAQQGARVVAGDAAELALPAEGVTEVVFYAVDVAGNAEAPQRHVVRLDRTPPALAFGPAAPAANAAGWNNTDVTVPVSASDALSGVAGVSPAGPLVFGAEGRGQVREVTAVDVAGNVATATSPAVSIDRTPPSLTGLPPAGCVLWPPNHQLVDVGTVAGGDALSGVAAGTLRVTGVSNEPADEKGDGSFAPDIFIDGGWVRLRAERSGTGTGRIYGLSATVQDAAGNTASAAASCTVPHSQRK